MKVLVVGGATQDVFVSYQGTDLMSITKKDCLVEYALFQSGEKVEVDALFTQTGGGCTNAATSFKRLGFDVSCFCMVGNDTQGTLIEASLKRDGIDVSQIKHSKTKPSGLSVIINSTHGERTIFAYRGANADLPLEEITPSAINTIDQLYITSLSHNSSLHLGELVRSAHAQGVPIAINPGQSQLANGTKALKESLSAIDTLILNSYEAQVFMHALVEQDISSKQVFESPTSSELRGINMKTPDAYLLTNPIPYQDHQFSIHKFFSAVLAMGPSIVVVTNGSNGVYVATRDELLFHPSLNIEVINSVGAGDAFGSTFIASLRLGYAVADALRLGIIHSASVLQKVGAKSGLIELPALTQQLQSLDKGLLKRFSLK